MTVTALDPFFLEMKEYLSSKEDLVFERCSAGTTAKIALSKSIAFELAQERSLESPDAVKLLKLSKKLSAVQTELQSKQDEIIQDCVKIYRQAIEAPLPFVIGGSFLREGSSIHELVNFGILSTSEASVHKPFLSVIPNTTTGSIFCPLPWSLLRNDVFMLGATQSNHTFYVAGHHPLTSSDVWDEDLNHMKTLGREITILHLAGYKQVCPDELISSYGATFVKDKSHATVLKLSDFQSEIGKVKSAATILSFLNFSDS